MENKAAVAEKQHQSKTETHGRAEMEKLQVAIADDNERIVELLNTMIRSESGMEIVGKIGRAHV